MTVESFMQWMEKVITDFATVGEWLFKPIGYGINLAPIWLFTAGGLIVFVGVALIKWVIS